MIQFSSATTGQLKVSFWVSLIVIAIALLSCTQQNVVSVTPSASIPPTLQPEPTSTIIVWTPTPRPTHTPIPPSPTPTRVACNLNGPYIGASNRDISLVNILEDCTSQVTLGPRGNNYAIGGWLPDGSGFIYTKVSYRWDGSSVSDVCIWDVVQQATTRCLIRNGDNYGLALWSPGDTNYIAYYRYSIDPDREFVTVAEAESGKVVYETDRSLLNNGTAERLFAWHPDGKHILMSVSSKTKQSAVVLNIETGSRRVLATFDGEDKEYLVKGIWVQGGANVVLSLIDPLYYRSSADFVPEARDLYWVRGDGTGLKLLLKDDVVGYYIEDPTHDRLLLSSYALSSESSPLYWLDLQRGTLTEVLSDKTKIGRLLYGLTPDGRYIITLNGRYQTHLFDVETGEVKQLGITVLGPIVWKPQP